MNAQNEIDEFIETVMSLIKETVNLTPLQQEDIRTCLTERISDLMVDLMVDK